MVKRGKEIIFKIFQTVYIEYPFMCNIMCLIYMFRMFDICFIFVFKRNVNIKE